MDIRRGVAGLGRTMIAAGVVILLFVSYQLWGTGLAEARSQRELRKEFERSLAESSRTTTTTTTTTTPGSTSPGETTVPTTAAPDLNPPPAPAGDAVAIIKIPKLGVEKTVVQGVSLGVLKRGPGHYPATPMPGQPGNAAIAGHRTTYGAPFFRLNELDTGDPILVTTRQGRFRYEVEETRIVRPSETSVLGPSEDNRLTLTTCNPRFSAAQRLVVIAVLKGEAAELPPVTTTVPPVTTPGATTTTTAPQSFDFEEAEEEGLSGRNAANGPALTWGLAAAAVWLLTWLAGRRWRRWPAYLLGTPVFLVVLFVFFENFSRLLPSNF
ncbi:MAG: class E sortase [Acidimicrobiales bacterium]